jgi:DNA polymerase-3 subunit gamma/tau
VAIVSQAFYRKWRPRTFQQVVGQEHVTQTLQNALRDSRIVHAYLFSGPRGTGKTSTARILAKAVNCLTDTDDRPCNDCAMCKAIDEGRAMDLIEIDAASHTGVDHVRDLRDKISFSPADAKYKFYIVDEVHMLSTAAFNALLKTLEEPPPHAIFVLATTEVHKVPATVLSRCQRFDFRRIPLKAMVKRLTQISGEEGLAVEDGVLDLIARQSTGSLRDAESLLDQLATYGGAEVTMEQAHAVLGTASSRVVSALVGHLCAADVAGGLSTIGQATTEGTDPRQLTKELLDYLRGLLLIKTTDQAPSDVTVEQEKEMSLQAKDIPLDRLVASIKAFNRASLDLKNSAQPQLPLELAFVESVLDVQSGQSVEVTPGSGSEPTLPASSQTERQPHQSSTASSDTKKPRVIKESKRKYDDPQDGKRQSQASHGTAAYDLDGVRSVWDEVIATINGKNMHLAAVARSCRPAACEEDVLTIHVESPFHKERLESSRARKLLEDAVKEVSGRTYRIRCVLAAEVAKDRPQDTDLQELSEDPVVRTGLDLGGKIGSVR